MSLENHIAECQKAGDGHINYQRDVAAAIRASLQDCRSQQTQTTDSNSFGESFCHISPGYEDEVSTAHHALAPYQLHLSNTSPLQQAMLPHIRRQLHPSALYTIWALSDWQA